MTEEKKIETMPFDEQLDVSDAAAVPDGTYPLELTRLEMYEGTKYQSEEPQDKLRFVLTVLSGPEQGAEVWNIENLPDRRPDGSRKPLGKKSGIRKFMDALRGGHALKAGESASPNSLVDAQGVATIANGKIASFVRMDLMQQQQAADSLPLTGDVPPAKSDSEYATKVV